MHILCFSTGFPGCQPVSMDLKNLTFLRDNPYKVSWKADGTRYMMYVGKEEYQLFFGDTGGPHCYANIPSTCHITETQYITYSVW